MMLHRVPNLTFGCGSAALSSTVPGSARNRAIGRSPDYMGAQPPALLSPTGRELSEGKVEAAPCARPYGDALRGSLPHESAAQSPRFTSIENQNYFKKMLNKLGSR
ncbi:MAG: hypothetical protein Kow0099_21060 [Candidatus Abyssubacteria bacterium]